MTRSNRNGRASKVVPNPTGKDSAVNSNSARLKVTRRASRASKVNRESSEKASKVNRESSKKASRASKARRVRDKRRVETLLKGASSDADQDNNKAVRVVVLCEEAVPIVRLVPISSLEEAPVGPASRSPGKGSVSGPTGCATSKSYSTTPNCERRQRGSAIERAERARNSSVTPKCPTGIS